MCGNGAKRSVYPKHGWVPAKEQGKAFVFLPFLGCMAHELDRLKKEGDDRLRSFRRAYLDLERRLVLAFKSLHLWLTMPGSAGEGSWLLEHSLYTDLVLYELACVFDSLAKTLAHFLCRPGNSVNDRNFHEFVKWVKANRAEVDRTAPWMAALLTAPGLGDVKVLRNRRTHDLSSISTFLRVSDGAMATCLFSTSRKGASQRADVAGHILDVTRALLDLLEGAANSLEPDRPYCDEDVLGWASGGLLPSYWWDGGTWLEGWLPKLWDQPWEPWESGGP